VRWPGPPQRVIVFVHEAAQGRKPTTTSSSTSQALPGLSTPPPSTPALIAWFAASEAAWRSTRLPPCGVNQAGLGRSAGDAFSGTIQVPAPGLEPLVCNSG